ncbi:MAG: hypothetical protein AB8H86_27720 [Polyangiales bacterium]
MTSPLWMLEDRRTRRSVDCGEALRYQLEYTREKGGLEAVVLSDEAGLVVAGAGENGVCEELGAYAPLLCRSPMGMRLPPLLRGGEVAVRSMALHGSGFFISCLGGGVARDALLSHSTRGVERILTTN